MIQAFVYFFLTSISALGDHIFLYFVSFMLLKLEYGGILSAMILGMDAIFEILIGPQLAKFTDSIPELYHRLKFAKLTYILLIPLTIFPFINFQVTPFRIVWLFLSVGLIRFLLLFDQQLQSAVPLQLEKKKLLPLAQGTSLFIFTQRSIPLLSSSLAAILIGSSFILMSLLNSVSYVLGIAGLIFILRCMKSCPKHAHSSEETNQSLSNRTLSNHKEWALWYCMLQFLTSFAFGSIVLILNKSILSNTNLTPSEQIMHGSGAVYFGMLLALVFITVYPLKNQLFSKVNGKNVCYYSFTLGFAIILTTLSKSYLQIFFLFISGIINGFSLVALNTFFQRKFEGRDFVKALAKSHAARKVGVLLSLLLTGLCIDLSMSVDYILCGFGLVGMLVSLIMTLRAYPLEVEQITSIDVKDINSHIQSNQTLL